MKINFLDTQGIIVVMLYFILAIIFGYFVRSLYVKEEKFKTLFIRGFLFKIIMGIGFAAIYNFYYHWIGDTIHYFNNACRMGDLLFTHPKIYFQMIIGQIDNTDYFNLPQGLSYYPNRNMPIYTIHRLISIFTIMGTKNYYSVSICMNAFLYLVNWKFFKFLNNLFPEKTKIIAISVLFVPSVVFWSSGLVKDAFVLPFTFIFIICFYKLLYLKKFKIKYILFFLLSIYILKTLKIYIIYSLIVSVFIYAGFLYLKKIKNTFIRIFVFPVIMLVASIGGLYSLQKLSTTAERGYTNVDSMLQKASMSQYDLKQDYYQGNSFDIGTLEPTVESAVSLTPAAIVAGLYRPFLWEARSTTMILSGLENFILFILTLYVLFKVGVVTVVRETLKNPLLIFCVLFSVIMAFGIGLSTSNFGSLVRFKIPFLPFWCFYWLYFYYYHKERIKRIK